MLQKRPKPLPPFQILQDLFKFDPISGQLFWNHVPWETSRWNSQNAGNRAGTVNKDGYIRIAYREHRLMAHRVVFYLCTGVDDPSKEVDHVNGVRHDNRIENLRQVTQAENCSNTNGRRSKELPVGVYPQDGKFMGRICRKGKVYYLGYFNTPEEASAAYQAKKRDLDGDVFVDRSETLEGIPQPCLVRGRYAKYKLDDISAMFA